MSLVIIDNYDSFTFNLVQLLHPEYAGRGAIQVFRNDKVSLSDLQSLRPSHIVLSPGPGHPANARDFGVCADVVKNARQLDCPILGVCLGHQGIILHRGGAIERLPRPLHGKQSRIRLHPDSRLFAGLPAEIDVMRYHSLVADRQALPADLAVTALEPEQGLVMAVEAKDDPVYGLQFHPESIGTPAGRQILRNFIRSC